MSDDLQAQLAKIFANVPEISPVPPAHSTVRIPELRNVVLTRRTQALVDHPAFQRLRRIRQLGPTHLVYPGANHTRFEHSLGVFDCVRLYVLSLLRNPTFAISVTAIDILTVLAAGLLHDVGHYSFAHNLEALHHKGRDTPRHEDVGARIVRGEIESLRGARPLGDVLQKEWGVDPERVFTLCTGKLGKEPSQIDSILHSIVSSAIDADKMDYLERDSIHLGVPYGRNYDRDRLLASLTLDRDERRIAVLSKGKVSAEIFIFGRYTMFSEAYWHHTVRSAAAMLEAALAAFHSRSQMSGDELLTVLLARDDDEFLAWLRDASPAGGATQYLVDGLVGNERHLYKRVATFSRAYLEPEKQAVYERIYQMSASEVYDLADRLRARLSYMVGRPLHPADVIVDTPPRDKDKLETVDLVYASAHGQQYYRLHELSRVVAGMQDDFVKVVKKIRIFVEPRLAAELAKVDGVYPTLVDEILSRKKR